MDPTSNLYEQLRLAARIQAIGATAATAENIHALQDEALRAALRLAELVEALHGWISAGGFVPNPWQR